MVPDLLGLDRVPIVERIEHRALVDVDDPGVALGPPADMVAPASPLRSTLSASPLSMSASPSTSGVSRVQALQLRVGELRRAFAHAQLIEARALAHQDREGARRNLGIERAVIARLDAVEAWRAVGDQAGEDVEPPGGTFGIGDARNAEGELRAFRAAARHRRSPSPAPRRWSGRSRA